MQYTHNAFVSVATAELYRFFSGKEQKKEIRTKGTWPRFAGFVAIHGDVWIISVVLYPTLAIINYRGSSIRKRWAVTSGANPCNNQ